MYGTVQSLRTHTYNESQARTAVSRANHFDTDFLRYTRLTDPVFIHQSLPEMFALMAMYVVYLGMGHTLLCKTIKAKTIRGYVGEAAKLIQSRRKAYARMHPQSGLIWFSPI
jgi:hypothetical protein